MAKRSSLHASSPGNFGAFAKSGPPSSSYQSPYPAPQSSSAQDLSVIDPLLFRPYDPYEPHQSFSVADYIGAQDTSTPTASVITTEPTPQSNITASSVTTEDPTSLSTFAASSVITRGVTTHTATTALSVTPGDPASLSTLAASLVTGGVNPQPATTTSSSSSGDTSSNMATIDLTSFMDRCLQDALATPPTTKVKLFATYCDELRVMTQAQRDSLDGKVKDEIKDVDFAIDFNRPVDRAPVMSKVHRQALRATLYVLVQALYCVTTQEQMQITW
jgi:hypothetical protein